MYYNTLNDNVQIDIFKDKVEIYDLRSETVNIKTHDEILTGEQVFCDLNTNHQIILNIIPFAEKEHLSEAGKKTYDFYRNYELSQIWNIEIETQCRSHDKPRRFARFDAHGISHYKENVHELYLFSQQRISDFFFKGPGIPSLPLSLRKDLMRKIISNINGYNMTFCHEGHKLLDYDKIKEKSFEINSADIPAIKTVLISKEGITIKSTILGKEWIDHYSLEVFRLNTERIAWGWQEAIIAEIVAIITAAEIDLDFNVIK